MSTFLHNEADPKILDVCLNSQSRYFIQFTCIDSTKDIATKVKDIELVSILEAVTCLIVVLAVIFNARQTVKLNQQYDELNLTASDYTVYLNVTSRHRHEFNQKFGSKIEQSSQYSRGYYFKKFISDKLRY